MGTFYQSNLLWKSIAIFRVTIAMEMHFTCHPPQAGRVPMRLQPLEQPWFIMVGVSSEEEILATGRLLAGL